MHGSSPPTTVSSQATAEPSRTCWVVKSTRWPAARIRSATSTSTYTDTFERDGQLLVLSRADLQSNSFDHPVENSRTMVVDSTDGDILLSSDQEAILERATNDSGVTELDDDVANEVKQLAEEIVDATESLSDQAHQLRELLDTFEVSERVEDIESADDRVRTDGADGSRHTDGTTETDGE